MADIRIRNIATIAPWANDYREDAGMLTATTFALVPEDGNRYELVEGSLVQMPPPKPKHGRIAAKINHIVSTFVEQHHLGEVYAAETDFLINQNPDTVLAPDVAFVRAERLVSSDEEEYFPFAPDLVVGVASPDQSHNAMAIKAQRWLASGARLVWVIWPKAQQVDIWQTDQSLRTLAATDSLDGAEILPGFTCQASEFF